MTLAELAEHVTKNPRYGAEEATVEGPGGEPIKGVVVSDTRTETAVHLSFGRLNKMDWPGVVAAAACGRDVDHITRVTGYFSKTSGWNKGKTQELKDRHRTRIG